MYTAERGFQLTTTEFTPEDSYKSANGYITWKIGGRWQAAHRFIMEGKLGRQLLPGERVKFVDGDKTNLDPDNIELAPTGESKEDRIAFLHRVIDSAQEELRRLEET